MALVAAKGSEGKAVGVPEEGIAQHYTGFQLPVTGINLNPRMDLAA